jgi:hypothetical protein
VDDVGRLNSELATLFHKFEKANEIAEAAREVWMADDKGLMPFRPILLSNPLFSFLQIFIGSDEPNICPEEVVKEQVTLRLNFEPFYLRIATKDKGAL